MQNLLELTGPVPWYVPWIAGILGLVLSVFLLRGLMAQGRRLLSGKPIEELLTVVAASIATGVSAQGMWRFSGDVLGLDGPLRLLLFAFIEVAIITSAVRARRNMRANFSAGIDGIAVWALTCLTAVLSSMDARSLPEAVFRLAAPLVAAWLWERGMAIERHRIRGTGRINWRLTPERVLVRLGLAEATDRTAGDVDRQRRISRAALAVLRVDDQQHAKPSKRRKALGLFRKRVAQAVEHAGLASDETAQQALLDQIDTLRSVDALVARQRIARWADPVTQEKRAEAIAAIEQEQRFDSAEATQRALDKAAVTLMALTERVTFDVTSAQVNSGINGKVNNGAVPPSREAGKLTFPMTSPLTVESVNGGLKFDVNDNASYDLAQLLAADPYMTPLLTPELIGGGVNNGVNEDPRDASKTQVMRDFWESEVAEDRYPTVKDLATHADVDPAHASRKRKEWVAELPWRQRRKADPRRSMA
ncbi:hypothetical protein ACIBK9_46955 [Nonomuraea sp. NPDC050227]|uniref:hypothetical protein n=1 Tax=Nonomuraea sp. NPDC050227 TaxID=3364360 RepID=UPI0037A0FE83